MSRAPVENTARYIDAVDFARTNSTWKANTENAVSSAGRCGHIGNSVGIGAIAFRSVGRASLDSWHFLRPLSCSASAVEAYAAYSRRVV